MAFILKILALQLYCNLESSSTVKFYTIPVKSGPSKSIIKAIYSIHFFPKLLIFQKI